MKKLTYLAAMALIAVTTLVGCSKDEAENNGESAKPTEVAEPTEVAATEITITHDLGTVVVPINPKKAVIFDFGILDTARELGVEAELAVATASLPGYLSEYSENVSAGSLKAPDLEAIFDFEPEVIFISGRQQDYYDQLSEIAPTIYVSLDSTKYMEDFRKNVGIVADVFNVKEAADAKLGEIDALAATIIEEISTKDAKALIILTNDGGISAYGKGSRFGLIHDYLGVKTADDAIVSSTHGQEANYEYISQINPDIMFVVDRTEVVGGTTTVSSVLDNELINGTNAAKNSKIIKLDPDYWYLSGGGLISVKGMITEIGNAMK